MSYQPEIPPSDTHDDVPPFVGHDVHPSAPQPGDIEPIPPTQFHPAYIGLYLARSLRAFLLPLIFIVATGNWQQLGFLAVAGVIALLSVLNATLSWWFTRYEVTDRELRLRSGWLNRQERSVPLERIQAIDVDETPLARVLGVMRLKIETAAGGGSGSDVVLDAVSRADGMNLRERLIRARARLQARGQPGVTATGIEPAAETGVFPASDATLEPNAARNGSAIGERFQDVRSAQLTFGESGEIIRTVSIGELLIAGATSARIGPLLALVGFGFQFLSDLLPFTVWERLARETGGIGFQGALILAVSIGLAAWLLAIGSTVLTFWGFTLRRDGDQLQIATGLLDRRRSTIPLKRIQAVTISEPLMRQPLGYCGVRIESAGYGADTGVSGTLFPILPIAAVDDLLSRACPDFASDLRAAAAAGDRLPKRAAPRYAIAPIWDVAFYTVVGVVLARILPAVTWWVGLAPLALIPFAIGLGLLRYRDAYWCINTDDHLIIRGRGYGRRTTIMPRTRIQWRRSTQNPLQRRSRLATFTAAVASAGAGGRATVSHMERRQADLLGLRLTLGDVPRRRPRATSVPPTNEHLPTAHDVTTVPVPGPSS